jgi:CheY-like chemotaxis protein
MARVLVVDDEPDLISLLVDQLTALGHDVIVARDGVQGVQEALARRPDVVLTDVIMPFMDGPEMLERLRAEPETRGIPVIALSALTDSKTRARMSSLGVRCFLGKPYSLKELASQIQNAVSSTKAK